MGTDGSIGYRVTPLGAGEVGSRTLRIWKAKPDYTDITIDGTVWLGYFNGTDYDICRVNYCEDVLTRTWATGAWDDRYTLLPFCGYTTTTTEELVTTTTGEEVTTTTTSIPFFMMKFDTLANASLTVGGDATDVADWNTFFNLPTNGTPFDNIQIVGNTPTEITLYGSDDLSLAQYYLFSWAESGHEGSILEIESNINFPYCNDGVFAELTGLTRFINDNLTIGFDYMFNYSENLVEISLISLTEVGEEFFWLTSITEFILPNVTKVKQYGFDECYEAETIYIPKCTDLGGTVGNNDVFLLISGNTITLTVPAALITCNAGQPDGDIQALQAANTVTVIQV